ncbi:MAG: helix-turn-helix domain-containing protein [Firmicutes bacterium]|nr:helix-turn-helix domain-containing protein [Bacillota bacterium]
MIPIRIPAEDMKVLEEERYTHPHPRVQRKLHTLYLVGLGYPRHDVARIIGVSEGTVRNFIHAYQAGGLEALRQFNPHPKTAALDRHATTLRETFTAQPPHTVQEAVDRIESLTGVRRSPTQVREWLKKTGLTVVKPAKSRPKRTRSRSSYSWIPHSPPS